MYEAIIEEEIEGKEQPEKSSLVEAEASAESYPVKEASSSSPSRSTVRVDLLRNRQKQNSDNNNIISRTSRPPVRADLSPKLPIGDPSDPHNLDIRFVSNQLLLFDDALAEIKSGAKRSCWLWFVLPTAPHIVNGLERGSHMNQYFALRGDDAASAYLKFERKGVNLRNNYMTILKAIHEQLERGNTMLRLFGPMDLNKATSSFQLFCRIAHDTHDLELEMLCQSALKLVTLDKEKREARNQRNDESNTKRMQYCHTMTV